MHARLSVLVPHLSITFGCGTPEYDFASVLPIRVLYLNTSDPNGEENTSVYTPPLMLSLVLVLVKKGQTLVVCAYGII